MKARSILAAAVAACLAHSPALAEDEAKPVISITTKAAEITVTIKNELQPYPALVDDSLAEGKRWAATMRAEAEKAYKDKDEREFFKDGRRYSYDRVYEFRSFVGGRYVSVIRSDGTFTGGAHPNQVFDTILWDNEARKRISIRPFFTETADGGPTMTALAKLVRKAVAIAKRDRMNEADGDKQPAAKPAGDAAEPDELVIGRVQPKLTKLGPVTLAPSKNAGKSAGLTIHYSPYDVDAYAAGPYTIFVPWIAFKARLSPAGAAIFDGARPKGDEDEN